ncbi:transcriptional regulator, AraC family with amidase-like domain [Chitinophaga jiangningensis]|uniref:Transcriptional regulator, AraC family with amidase-like domain n=1 Tax=Chitinophaga jiangningensis TaxID=1419482 RepID=A0A1M7BU73_9BACT|nr:helix-turn-helix domain-containing protein [Chitinophaga jiangningensis]SHL58531.1 transcriptional regulator, AraC family with amidase-like domain [Chitinophaga jiangningensis]
MKHVSILIPFGASSLSNIEGTWHILTEVNTILKRMDRDPIFDVHFVGISNLSTQRNGVFTIQPDSLVHQVRKTDMIVIPAMHQDPQEALRLNQKFIPWIKDQYAKGAEIISYCIGAFFLAGTGLLDGRRCATHWASVGDFRMMYPNVDVVDERILTEEEGIYTSGGAYSYLNLLLYLVEKYAGREVAIVVAKTFMIDIDRDSQSPFIMFQGQKAHEDEPVKKAQEFIEQNFSDRVTVDQLANMLALGRRSLERRFKKATSNTVTEYIQRVKIEVAKKSFESSRKNISEVMYDVGYADIKAFRTIFRKVTGLSPIEYRNKYNKTAAAAAV